MPATVRKNPVDLMFRAFSDKTRSRILRLLGNGELCVCDIVAVLDLPQPRVSRHLSYLRRARLVRARRDEQWMYYTLTRPADAFHRKLLECLDCCFSDVPELARDAKALARRRRGGPCCE